MTEGQLIACEVVWTETASFFPTPQQTRDVMERLGLELSSIKLEAALFASSAWRTYRRRGGKRQRIAADFLIGAHASLQADRLLTRDRGFYRSYFGKLHVLDPSVQS